VKLQSKPRFINKGPMMSKEGLRAILLSGGAVFAAVATMPTTASAEDANTRMASPIEAQFMAWGKAGAFASGSAIVFSTRDPVGFESDEPGNPFSDLVWSSFTMKFDTRLPFMGVGERPAQDLGELIAGIQAVCEKAGGSLKRDVPNEVHGGSLQINQNLSVLKKASLLGRFTCESAQEDSRFLVEVAYAGMAKPRLLPPAWDWEFVVSLVSASQFQASQRRASEYAAQIQTTRANVKPGMEIQVLASDLPEELGAPLNRFVHGGKPSVCAMVIDVKPPLAQIQVKQASLFVPIEKLLPKGEARPISKIEWNWRGFPHKWCGQY
jgi:hypothetical protein